jgi:hypothetical protein
MVEGRKAIEASSTEERWGVSVRSVAAPGGIRERHRDKTNNVVSHLIFKGYENQLDSMIG